MGSSANLSPRYISYLCTYNQTNNSNRNYFWGMEGVEGRQLYLFPLLLVWTRKWMIKWRREINIKGRLLICQNFQKVISTLYYKENEVVAWNTSCIFWTEWRYCSHLRNSWFSLWITVLSLTIVSWSLIIWKENWGVNSFFKTDYLCGHLKS